MENGELLILDERSVRGDISPNHGEDARIRGGEFCMPLAHRRQHVRRLCISAQQNGDRVAGHLLMVERHGLAALVLQDRRGREVANAERRWLVHGRVSVFLRFTLLLSPRVRRRALELRAVLILDETEQDPAEALDGLGAGGAIGARRPARAAPPSAGARARRPGASARAGAAGGRRAGRWVTKPWRTSWPSTRLQALLGDLQDVEQRRRPSCRVAADEIDDPVMGAAEAVGLRSMASASAVKSR